MGVLKGQNEYFECHYKDGIKHGPYKKRIGDDYEEEGEHQDDELHGSVKIRKGEFNGHYQYDRGNKLDDSPGQNS